MVKESESEEDRLDGDDDDDNWSFEPIVDEHQDDEPLSSQLQEECQQSTSKDYENVISELDDANIDKFFAVHWPTPCTYYWGQLRKVFSDDPDADADKVEMKFLKRKENYIDPGRLLWDWPVVDDIDIIDANWCFLGPEKPILTNAVRGKAFMKFSKEAEAMKKFKELCKN